MIAIELPAPRGGTWLGVMVERHDLGGLSMLAVTIRPRAGQPTERTWHGEDAAALAYALSQADARQLPLFDLRDEDCPD